MNRSVEKSRSSKLGHTAPLVWLGLFAFVVIMLGGSSRPDAVQIAALRPLAALFLIPALFALKSEDLREAKALVVFVGLAALWIAFQLVPLPPSLWGALPGRDLVANLDQLTGLGDVWRPIAWVPSRGWNSLASLIVPLSALLLALAMRPTLRMLLLIIACIGLLDALLGLAQILIGRSSPLYFYAITNQGSPVGFFANENHSAVFSAIALLVIARLGATALRSHDATWIRIAYLPIYVVILLSIFVSGSRAGILAAGWALLASAIMIWLSVNSKRSAKKADKFEKWLSEHPRILIGFLILLAFGLLVAFYQLERAPGLEGFLVRSSFDGLRVELWPIILQMIREHVVFGVGLGSFEEVYHIYEPIQLLQPRYINQAHNDWAQLVIEGGIPAVILLFATLCWISSCMMSSLQAENSPFEAFVFWGSVFSILSVASLVDYPLRTPIFQFVVIWLLLSLAMERKRGV